MPLPPGSRLGNYEILARIGAGGMGEVYRARDPKLGRDVAIKVLPEDVARDPERLARFEREARSLAALNHPGIVTIFAVEEADGSRFLAMELVEGDGLDTLVPSGGLPLPRFLEIAVPLAEALSAAHERGIVHRDLKPGNVMVTHEGRVKVLDFGLARVEAADSNADLTSTPTESRITNLTSEGQVFGTVAYMSPEQARGAKVDARSDVFSLGIVMYQMLTGERPFHGATAVDVISSILRDRPASVTELRADLPSDLARVVRRCLEKEPRDRYQTSRDVYNELRELRSEIASGVVSDAAQALPGRERSAPSSGPRPARLEIPWIAVLPFLGPTADTELEAFADGLAEDITTGLSRFRYLSVVSRASTAQLKGHAGDVRAVAARLGARYVLEGSVRKSGASIRLSSRLIEAATGTQLWAATYDRDLQSSGIFDVQDDVAARIVATVADSYGVLVRSLTAALQQKPDEDLSSSEWLFQYFAYRQLLTPAAHAALKSRLERAVERDARQSDLWASLALVHTDEYAFGFQADPATLDRALAAARRAVELDRTNQFPLLSLAQAHFFRQELAAFRPAAEQAMALNPLNTDALGILGLMIVHTGEFQRGAAIVRRAMELNPSHAGWFHFGPIWEHFERAEYERALEHAMQVNMPGLFWQPLVIAAICGQLGRRAEGAAAVRDLLALDPGFGKHGLRDIAVWHFASGLLDRILDGVRRSGLEIGGERGAAPPAQGEPTSSGGERPGSSPPVSGAVRADDGFWIAVLPFRSGGTGAELSALADGLTDELVTGLSRFSYLRVISRGSTRRFAGDTTDVRAVGREVNARYVLEGGLRQAGPKLRVAVQLVDTASGAQLWSETYDQEFRNEAVFEVQDAIVPRIVSTVADMNGVLPRSMSDVLRHRPPDSLSPHEAVLRSFGYFERVTPEDLAASRSALELAVRKEPAYADAWAMLALMSVQDYAQGFGLHPDALEHGFDAARRAVDLAPTSPLSHFALAQALFFRKEREKFRHEAERTVSLNPLDGSALALVGEMLAHSGEWERGLALSKRARELNPHHPGWYWYVDFWDAYRRHDYASAREFALKSGTSNHWGAHLNLAAASAQLGDREAAAQAIREALRLRPSVAETFREDARKWFDPEFAEHLIDGLRKAGLDVREAGEGSPTASAPSTAPAGSTAGPGMSPFSGSTAGPRDASAASTGAARRRGWMAAAAAVVLLAAGLWLARSRTRTTSHPTEAPSSSQRIRSLAVLPLDNYSGDPGQDYFAEGMTDELTSDLANISGLRVISRGSAMQFAGKKRPPTPEIAKKLDVDAVVEGSVHRSGDKVRINAQLIDARSDRHLWSKSFERNSRDVLALQDELASAIAQEIHVRLTPEEQSRLTRAASVNPEAYDAYLKGRYFFNRPNDENLSKAIEKFEEAIRLDPKFAPAHSGLSDVYLWAGYNEGVLTNAEAGPKAKAAAQEAIRLDDASAEAHASLATYQGWYAHDWPGSEAEYRRSFALNPNYSFAHDQFGILLALEGRLDESVAEGRRAAELDPLSPQIPIDALMAYTWQGRYPEARELARKAANLDPTYFFPPFMEGWMEIQAGRVKEAIPLLEKARALGAPPFLAAWLGYAHGVTGDRARAMAAIDELKALSLKGYVPPFNLALVYLGLGDRARALDYLEQAYDVNSQWMPYLRGDRTFDSLRSEPRFQALMKKLNFPA